jgi:hypothetical protein
MLTAELPQVRTNYGRPYAAVGGDLRRRLGQPTRTNVSSGSDIANSYMPTGPITASSGFSYD